MIVLIDGKEKVLWSYRHPCCRLCKTTEKRHVARGLCATCNSRERSRAAYQAKVRAKKK